MINTQEVTTQGYSTAHGVDRLCIIRRCWCKVVAALTVYFIVALLILIPWTPHRTTRNIKLLEKRVRKITDQMRALQFFRHAELKSAMLTPRAVITTWKVPPRRRKLWSTLESWRRMQATHKATSDTALDSWAISVGIQTNGIQLHGFVDRLWGTVPSTAREPTTTLITGPEHAMIKIDDTVTHNGLIGAGQGDSQSKQRQGRRLYSKTAQEEMNEKKMVVLNHKICTPGSHSWEYFKQYAGACGKPCISLFQDPEGKKSRVRISEFACKACLHRAGKCPQNAAKIVRLPPTLVREPDFSYGLNSFRIHGLLEPRPGKVLGLLGCNGIGKTTALKIISGKLKPNLGRLDDPPTLKDIIKNCRGGEEKNYFKLLYDGKMTVVIKPQVDQDMVKALKGNTVGDLIKNRDQRNVGEHLKQTLNLQHLNDRAVEELSGGELQRLAIVLVAINDADCYIFDEPSSFLDVKQRITAIRVIRSLAFFDDKARYVIGVEHDYAILDYMADHVQIIYGEPGAYGKVTIRTRLQSGINQYLSGYIKLENMQFRDHAINFKIAQSDGRDVGAIVCKYPAATKVLKSKDGKAAFTLHIERGDLKAQEVIGLIGENGMGKTTYMQMLAGAFDKEARDQGDESSKISLVGIGQKVAYKRQDYAPALRRYRKTVRKYLEKHLPRAFGDKFFKDIVMKPLNIDDEFMDLNVTSLSGGELQRFAIVLCLGTDANVYLLDEPSAGLDCEQRGKVATVIKRWTKLFLQKTTFVIEHDCLMMSALADRMILFTGTPGVETTAHRPCAAGSGFNKFLETLGITFRRDPHNYRPRLNKNGSARDRQQKQDGEYFCCPEFSSDEEDDE